MSLGCCQTGHSGTQELNRLVIVGPGGQGEWLFNEEEHGWVTVEPGE